MKKFLIVLFTLLAAASLFAATSTPATGTLAGTQSGSSTVNYTYKPSSADTFKIGFTNSAVDDFSDVKAAADFELAVAAGATEASIPDTNPVYIYWQIDSRQNKTLTVTLKASSMHHGDGTVTTDAKEYINVELTTSKASDSANDGDAITTALTTAANSTAKAETAEQTVLTFNAANFATGQCAGSQKIGLVTNTIYGIYAGDNTTYTGTLTATVSVQ